MDIISQFTSDIHHVKGTQNGPAEMLSHLHANTSHVEPNVVINFVCKLLNLGISDDGVSELEFETTTNTRSADNTQEVRQ